MKLLLTEMEADLEVNVEIHWVYGGSIARKAGVNL